MTERARQLHATTDAQISELMSLISTLDDAALRLPCPGREKLGDGTIAASARHTADSYQRIGAFVQTSGRMSGTHQPDQHRAHRIPRFLRALGHGPADHAEHGAGEHDGSCSADNIDPRAVADQLSSSRGTLGRLAELTDSQLDAIPPKDSFRFCDGQRTLEQVLASLLKHQTHQLDALTAATRSAPDQPPGYESPAHGRAGNWDLSHPLGDTRCCSPYSAILALWGSMTTRSFLASPTWS